MSRPLLSVLILTALLWVSLSSCDRGLEPPPLPPSISGHITFHGTWPVKDSVRNLALVLVPSDPPFRIDTLIGWVSRGIIKTIVLHYRNSDTTFTYGVTPGHYGYLGIAEEYGPGIFTDWRGIAFCANPDGTPRAFDIKVGDEIEDANIIVNLDSLPAQPFIR